MKTTTTLATLLLLSGCTARTIGQEKVAPDLALATEGLPTVPVATGDMAVATGCVQLATWSANDPIGAGNNTDVDMGIAWVDNLNQGREPGLFGGTSDVLFYEFSQPVGTPVPTTFPHALDFSSTHESLGIQFGLPNPPAYLMATSGDVTVTAADDTQPVGDIAVHGTNVLFRELDAEFNVEPNGRCVQLGSFALSGHDWNQN